MESEGQAAADAFVDRMDVRTVQERVQEPASPLDLPEADMPEL